MRYQQGDFFADREDDTVRGFAIIETSDEKYRIAEKWEPRTRDAAWVTYWITHETLHQRVDNDAAQRMKEMSDEQFDGICKLAGVESQDLQNAVAA